jgi:peptidoglycan/xylan/chitin deacetylase (PgdA/CDA1 family)
MRPARVPRVPILTYHQVGRFTPAEVRRQRGNYVDAERFAAQVRGLRRLGFQAVTLTQCSGPEPLPSRPVVFTFDDAYTNVFEHAFPALTEHGWPATTFVVSSELGGVNRWDLPKGIASAPLMGASELRELAASGWEVGAHSRTHPRLTELAPERLRDEIAGSRADLEVLLPQAVTSWCYPYGALNAQVVTAVHEAGFRAAVTLQPGARGPATPPLLLPRVHVGYRLGLTRFLWRFLPARVSSAAVPGA